MLLLSVIITIMDIFIVMIMIILIKIWILFIIVISIIIIIIITIIIGDTVNIVMCSLDIIIIYYYDNKLHKL